MPVLPACRYPCPSDSGRLHSCPPDRWWQSDFSSTRRSGALHLSDSTLCRDKDSGPLDPHYTLDSVSGEVRFGPSIRQPAGDERQYGKIPPADRRIRFSMYRAGGGIIGNVGQRTITVLKSSIPYIAAVTNFEPARGGIDTETLENAKLRAPRMLKASPRAVTQEDYENLALWPSLCVIDYKLKK